MDIEHKAERARALLNDDLVTEAIEKFRQDATAALTGCDPKDLDGLQFARLELLAAEKFVAQFRAHIETHDIKKGRHRDKHD